MGIYRIIKEAQQIAGREGSEDIMRVTKDMEQELARYYAQGKTQLFNYRKVYQIEFCHGTNSYILRELIGNRKLAGIPYTLRGRFVAYGSVQASKLLRVVN